MMVEFNGRESYAVFQWDILIIRLFYFIKCVWLFEMGLRQEGSRENEISVEMRVEIDSP